jgi:hypothetical protein
MYVGTELPPPTRPSALLLLLGPKIDTDHAVWITTTAMMIAMMTILRMSSSMLWIEVRSAWRRLARAAAATVTILTNKALSVLKCV